MSPSVIHLPNASPTKGSVHAKSSVKNKPTALPFAARATGSPDAAYANMYRTLELQERPMQNSTSMPQQTPELTHEHLGYPRFAGIDRTLNAAVGRFTGGVSPMAMMLAGFDWAGHLATQPAVQQFLAERAQQNFWSLLEYWRQKSIQEDALRPAKPSANDHRFTDPRWQQFPYDIWAQSFLLAQDWWHAAAYSVRGVSPHHADLVAFGARQLLDLAAPFNNVIGNPHLFEDTIKSGGLNLFKGYAQTLKTLQDSFMHQPADLSPTYLPGQGVAITEGQVILRTPLMELIQYTPTTPTVQAQPILITPAWIMKYYILDLRPENSFVKFLVDQGFTVFMISWINPTEDQKTVSFEDYLTQGFDAALDAIHQVIPDQPVHVAGYCLGGTLATIGTALHARTKENDVASLTLLAAQTDFTEAGELSLFVDPAQIAFLEDMMAHQGYLAESQMSGAFQLMRNADLIWSRLINQFYLESDAPLNDLMSWNADATRMPATMHSRYLRDLFLDNKLARGAFMIEGRPVSLHDLKMPIFAVGTEKDHVAPWRSVFKIHYLTDTDVTFCLTSGGHNAGIVSEPGHPRRHFKVHTQTHADVYRDPETWEATVPSQEGSWWPTWASWIAEKQPSERVKPPKMGAPDAGLAPLEAAPGQYIHMR